MSFYELRHVDTVFSLADLTVAALPDPDTGTWPVIAVGRVTFKSTGEVREQMVYLGDVGRRDPAAAQAAVVLGLAEMESTIRRRLEALTPQHVMKNATRVVRRLGEVR